MKVSDVIDQIGRRISDPRNNRYKREEILQEINKALRQISSESECHKESAEIQIHDLKRVYEFPPNMIRPLQMTLEHITGELIFSTTFETLVASGNSFNHTSNQSSNHNAYGINAGGRNNIRIFFRDLVSDHQFIVDPVIEATNVEADTDASVLEFGT